MTASPLSLLAYRCATSALTPIIPLALRQRALRGKEDLSRIRERLGYASRARPAGQLIWIHGASVGETSAALPLIEVLLESPNRHVLMTSGTVTSATLMSKRLPARAVHQFAPVDTPSAIRRFLDHWRPDIGLFVDSEIWPNMLSTAHARGIKLVLVNGRVSARSFSGWQRLRRMAASLLSKFDLCLAQDDDSAERLAALGAANVRIAGSLKADAPPLPADAADLEALRPAIAARPVFLSVSTHPGEDEILLPAHDALRREYPDLLSIIVPRHPERGRDIAQLCGTRPVVRRSLGELPTEKTAVYIADTLGELGLFYRLASFAFVGGSLVPHGGQNPLEAARLCCAVLAGPHTGNFTNAYSAIFAAQGLGRVSSSSELAALAGRLIANPAEADVLARAAAEAAAQLGGAVARTRSAVEALLTDARA